MCYHRLVSLSQRLFKLSLQDHYLRITCFHTLIPALPTMTLNKINVMVYYLVMHLPEENRASVHRRTSTTIRSMICWPETCTAILQGIPYHIGIVAMWLFVLVSGWLWHGMATAAFCRGFHCHGSHKHTTFYLPILIHTPSSIPLPTAKHGFLYGAKYGFLPGFSLTLFARAQMHFSFYWGEVVTVMGVGGCWLHRHNLYVLANSA